MSGIPPVLPTDAEDVAWALQTAEALWKRNERVDAIVWLRRSAQAAGEAEDDDRALDLARSAAELSDWLAQNPNAASGAVSASGPPGQGSSPPTAAAAVDDLLRVSLADEYEVRVSQLPEEFREALDEPPSPAATPTLIPVDSLDGETSSLLEPAPFSTEAEPVSVSELLPADSDAPTQPRITTPVPTAGPSVAPPAPSASPARRAPPAPSVPPVPPAPSDARVQAPAAAPTAEASRPPPLPPARAPTASAPSFSAVRPEPVAEVVGGERITHVPSAAEKHAGLLDPWAEGSAVTRSPEPRSRATAREVSPPPPPASPPSASPPAASAPRSASPAPPPGVPAASFEPEEVVTSAPPVNRPPGKAPPPPPKRRIPPPPPSRPSVPPSIPPTRGVDLSEVEALSDLPDDARGEFASAAVVQQLVRDEEVAGFALALVLEGGVDLAATIVDAPAAHLSAGQVLRARGTVDHTTPLRLVCSTDAARVALWGELAVESAFRSCPWVEDDLRAAGDRYQAEVGITLGPLGERLDPGLRLDLTRRLTLRTLGEHEVCVTGGRPMPGLLLLGAGELELVDEAGAAAGPTLQAGDFVFPTEVMHASPAPSTVRAGAGGALVLFADRAMAQELLVTCPPLLEILAGV